MFQNEPEFTDFQFGWAGGPLGKKLAKIVPNGVVKINSRKDAEQFYNKARKRDFKDMQDQICTQMKKTIEWEKKMVLSYKLDPLLANPKFLDHPAVVQRRAFDKLMQIRKEKPPPKKLAMFKELDELYCRGLMTDEERMGIRFRDLEFGESIIYDFYKHGKLLKQKLYEHAKEIGMHLSRSKRRVSVVDVDVEMLKTMEMNTTEDIEISEAFDMMDTNGQNAISRRDVKFALKALGLEMPREQYIKFITRIEKNQEGLITKEKFTKEVQKLFSKRDVNRDTIKAFQLMDEDDKGKIDFKNLKNVALTIGEYVSDQEIINMLNAADDDGDGQVSLSEFLKLMNRARKVL